MRVGIGATMLAVALGGCAQEPVKAKSEERAMTPAAEKLAGVECALAGSSEFRSDCTAERTGNVLILRHPDGGFDRFELGAGENLIRPADGFENVQWRELGDGRIEAAIGGDHYRLKLPTETRAAADQ